MQRVLCTSICLIMTCGFSVDSAIAGGGTACRNRAAADWVLSIGGRIRTNMGYFEKAEQLPPQPFHITGIRLASNDKINDDGLAHLKRLNKLNNLFLAYTPIGDAGLKHIGGLTSLESLYLPYTKVGDAGLVHLKGLTNLVNLYLDGTQVTNAGLEQLKGLKALKVLYLRKTQIGDAALKHLKGMPQLRYIELSGTKVSDAGLKELQAALPNCTIKM